MGIVHILSVSMSSHHCMTLAFEPSDPPSAVEKQLTDLSLFRQLAGDINISS